MEEGLVKVDWWSKNPSCLGDDEMAVGEICVVEEDESESRKKRCAGTEIEEAVAAARPVTALNSPDVGAALCRRLFLSARRPEGLRGASFGHLTCCC